MAELGGISVGIDLKFLHGVFAELVRSAARPRAADRLTEKGVVIVGAVDDEGVKSAALSGKADIATANIEGDTWSEEHKVDEVAAVGREGSTPTSLTAG